MKLSEKRRIFADEYIRTGNVYQSALNAGYSDSYARTDASKILENPSVKSYIDNRLSKLKKESIADQDEVLQFLTGVLRGEKQESFPLGMGYGEQRLVDKELDGKDRIKAAELLLKRYPINEHDELKQQKTKRETEYIEEKTKLIKGEKKDTSMLESLVNVVNDDD